MYAKHRTARVPFLGRRRRATAVVRRLTGQSVEELTPTRHDGTQRHPFRVFASAFREVSKQFGGYR